MAHRRNRTADVGAGEGTGVARATMLTIAIVLLYRLGSVFPVPGVPYSSLVDMIGVDPTTPLAGAMSMLNMLAGGSLRYISLFSLSIMPYITATIIMQILGMAFPSIHNLQKDGASGANRINQYARYITLGLSLLNAVGYFFLFRGMGVSFVDAGAPEWMMDLMFIASLVGGSMLLMYMGEKITDTNLFNGPSILILVNVISSVPTAFYDSVAGNEGGGKVTALVCVAILLMIPFLVVLEMGQRRIPITYARQNAVRTRFARSTTYLPLKAMAQGVVPIIFASAIIYIPMQLAVFFPGSQAIQTVYATLASGPVSWAVQSVLIVLFSFFYAMAAMRPDDIAENLAKGGAFISDPMVPQGKATADFIRHTLYRVVMPASLVLAAFAVVPNILLQSVNNPLLQTFGGTSLLIVVGVVVQCIMAVDSQMTMKAYVGGRFKRAGRKAVFGDAYDGK